MIQRLAPCLVLALLACSSAPPAPAPDTSLVELPARGPVHDVKADLEAMQGSWIGPWVLRGQDAQPLSETPFEAKVEIAGDRLWLYAPDRAPMELIITLSGDFDPPFMDLSAPDAPQEPLRGVYAISGDTLLICSGKERPHGVIPCDGANQWLLALTSAERPQ